MISHINLGEKHIGKRSAGKLHAAFEEAGAGNGLTAPALDPTTEVFTPTSPTPFQQEQKNRIVRFTEIISS